MEKVIPIWKEVGESTHEIARKLAEKYGVKTSHTGTLDPTAEGVVIILLDEERHKKYEYAKWPKEYVFEIVFGIETDSGDGLGLFCHPELVSGSLRMSSKMLNQVQHDIKEPLLVELIGDYSQKYPVFSAKKILGKPLHWYARNNRLDEIEIPTKKGEIYEIELLETRTEKLSEIAKNSISKVEKTEGDLRQEKITKQWEKHLDNNEEFQIAKIRVKMSKGLYVRVLAKDIAGKLGTVGFVYDLIRTKNGKFAKEDTFGTLSQLWKQ